MDNNTKDILETVTQAAVKLNSLLSEADETLVSIRKGEGAAGKITQELAQATGKLNQVLTKVDDTLARVQRGEGSLGKLIQDDKLYGERVKVHRKLERLQLRLAAHLPGGDLVNRRAQKII